MCPFRLSFSAVMVAPRFSRYGKTSFVTGLINSATYAGSAKSTMGIALTLASVKY